MPANKYRIGSMEGIRTRKYSDFIVPMLAKTGEEAFDDTGWLFEIKWDGYRAIADLRKPLKLYSRNGLDFEKRFPSVADALLGLNKKMVLDGEIVAVDQSGLPSFQELQHAGKPGQILQYQVFDLLHLAGRDLTRLPLVQRKEILRQEMDDMGIIRYSDHVTGDGKALFEEIAARGLEGMMAKKADSEYRVGKRSSDWLKIRNHKITEAIILGYTEPQGSRKYFGSLILGRFDNGRLYWAGQVGTGFNDKLLADLYTRMQPLKISKSPIETSSFPLHRIDWIRPELVANIKYSEITEDGKFRHPVFMGIRDDKTPEDLKNE